MVEYHDEVEADFQQYYNMNVDLAIDQDLCRAGRLAAQLPQESRLVQAVSPAKDWTWDKEVQSRILAKLDEVACILVNANLKKGKKRAEPSEQFQPDYVKEAKKQEEKRVKRNKQVTEAEEEEIKAFWRGRYKNIRML